MYLFIYLFIYLWDAIFDLNSSAVLGRQMICCSVRVYVLLTKMLVIYSKHNKQYHIILMQKRL